jgi:hypothetical protein
VIEEQLGSCFQFEARFENRVGVSVGGESSQSISRSRSFQHLRILAHSAAIEPPLELADADHMLGLKAA